MDKEHNSSALAKQVSNRLGLSQEDELKLYIELSQIPNGMVKDALNALSAPTITKQSTKFRFTKS